MPRSRLHWFWGCALLVFLIEMNSQLIHRILMEVFSISISFDTWTAFLFGGLILLCFGAYFYFRTAREGIVTMEGLNIGSDTVITLDKVEQIINEGGGYPSVIFAAGGRKRIRFSKAQYAKLAKTRLNQWVIDCDKVEVTAGEQGQELTVKYSRQGKYNTLRLETVNSLVLIAAVILYLVSHENGYISLSLLLITGFIHSVIDMYKRVQVEIEGDKIRIIDGNKTERSFRFSAVDKVEKGIFQTKITTKSGEVFYFPQACLMLPELIEEFEG